LTINAYDSISSPGGGVGSYRCWYLGSKGI